MAYYLGDPPPLANSGASSGFAYASIASSLISAIGNAQLAKTAAKSQQSSLRFQADMAEINARMSESVAQSTLLAGQKAQGNLGIKYGKLKGSQRAALAANGVDLGVGSAAEVQASSDLVYEIDRNQIESNAIRSAWGYRTQGMNYTNQAQANRTSADSISPSVASTTALISGASQVADKWYSYNKQGMI
jgi:hypothetical protein